MDNRFSTRRTRSKNKSLSIIFVISTEVEKSCKSQKISRQARDDNKK
ncbi:MAG: hypothetical protein WCG48_02660 [Candidatus Berkelbacteria bacterium]